MIDMGTLVYKVNVKECSDDRKAQEQDAAYAGKSSDDGMRSNKGINHEFS